MRSPSASCSNDRIETPFVRDATELVRTSTLEHEPGTGYEVLHRTRDEDLTWLGQTCDACPDVHRDAADLLVDQLALARVHADADLHAEIPYATRCGERASDRPGGSIEGGEEPVACRVHLGTAIPKEQTPDHLVVMEKELLPSDAPELRRERRRANDIGEHDRREHAVDLCLFSAELEEETLDLLERTVLVGGHPAVVVPRQFDQRGPGDVIGDVPSLLDRLDLVFLGMQDECRDPDRGQDATGIRVSISTRMNATASPGPTERRKNMA
jgi:hypothetical protein